MSDTGIAERAENVSNQLKQLLPNDVQIDIDTRISVGVTAPEVLKEEGFPDLPPLCYVRFSISFDTPNGWFEMPFDITDRRLEEFDDKNIKDDEEFNDEIINPILKEYDRLNLEREYA